MNPTIWKMSGPFDPKIKAALPDCDRQSGWAMCFFII